MEKKFLKSLDNRAAISERAQLQTIVADGLFAGRFAASGLVLCVVVCRRVG